MNPIHLASRSSVGVIISTRVRSFLSSSEVRVLLPCAVILSSIYLLVPFNRPTDGQIPGYTHAVQRPIISFDDPRLVRRAKETDLELSKRLNQTIFESFYHCGVDDRARPLDSLVFWLLPARYEEHGFLNPVNMRCGFCHQSAYLLARALHLQGVAAWPWGLNGHVVTMIKVGNESMLLDPDFCVGPIDYDDYRIESIRTEYSKMGKWGSLLEMPYASTGDDARYHLMSKMERREQIQNWITIVLESLSIAIALLSALSLLRLSLAHWRHVGASFSKEQRNERGH